MAKVSKSKYERVAERNLHSFVELIVGGDAEEEERSDDEQDASENEDDYEEPEEPEDEAPAPKRRRTSAGASTKQRKPKNVVYKSAEFISDSDDSGSETVERMATLDNAEGKSKTKGTGKRGGEKAPRLKKAKEGSSKPTKAKAPPRMKEGDAEKGTEEEEARIKKMKALLVAAEGGRPFNQSTGAERTLSVAVRTERLEFLLNDVGLKVNPGGSLPSMNKASAIGEKRALEKEMKEISGVPVLEGLRGGKKRVSGGDAGSESEDDGGGPPPSKKPFGAFLNQSDSD